jgi:AraC-like DNA-binding protein
MDFQGFERYLANDNLTFELGYRNVLNVAHCGFHSHGSFELVYHLRGDGVIACGDGTGARFSEKSVVIHAPDILHSQTTRLPGEDACILFSAPKELSSALGDYFYSESLPSIVVAAEIQGLIDAPSPLSTLEKAAADHGISAIVARLLGSVDSASRNDNSARLDHASAAFNYIRENLGTITNLEHVATAVNLSYDHLRHLFKGKFGKSMKEQLSEMRISKSKGLLEHTPLPLKAIADMCGYSSDRYFCMVFKSMEGMTPGEFRHRARSAPISLKRY